VRDDRPLTLALLALTLTLTLPLPLPLPLALPLSLALPLPLPLTLTLTLTLTSYAMTDPFAPVPSSTRTDRSLTKLPPHASRMTTWDLAVPTDGAHADYHYP